MQAFTPYTLKSGHFSEKRCLFAGIYARKAGYRRNSCIFAGFAELPNGTVSSNETWYRYPRPKRQVKTVTKLGSVISPKLPLEATIYRK
ncbi:hypothetical protein [Paenibacillus aceti]|uniref:hypothetical protein n=1 Tax=Paenibacillus aceti TaxID=1820010 RepID=UPI0013C41C1F|nr:hypothetical protein [Paenibacillus aceti]